MEDKRQKDTAILEEYQKLEAKTFTGASEHVLGKEIEPICITPEELSRVDEVREELRESLEFLTTEQLNSLYSDDDTSLVMEAVKIVAKRGLEENKT